ncbi:MAG: flagellar biosynthesis protein FlhA [Armatimonadetes bacterium]|nr:flagellar biosynthesis protein FlhA [Armatimonadota bacterium]
MGTREGFLIRALQQSDIMLAVGIILLIGMMLIPLPPVMLDVLLTLNIALSLSVLLVSMYVARPLDFSVFPSLLLVATLYRLALNVSSTRLILLHAAAGRVIEAFGHFVVGGDLVVGMIVFLILVVIQFVVITSGSQRVAEVAARFTLDEMPGKQMSVDADLNAGIIDEAEARRRRREIEREADFYGAMDGAAKFVRGDAIAGVIIVAVNLLGGLAIGCLRLGLPIEEAVRRYCLLTVGDGLVSQIPALLLSTATGLVVTRSAAATNLGHEVAQQLVSQPRAVLIVAAMLMVFGAVPGLPKFSFLTLGAAIGMAGWMLYRRAQAIEVSAEEREQEAEQRGLLPSAAVNLDELLEVDRLSLEVGYGLLPLMDRSRPGNVPERLTALRRQIAMDLGIVIPPVHIRDNIDLPNNAYAIRLRERMIGRDQVRPGKLLAIAADPNAAPLPGEEVREPAFGLAAWWIDEGVRPLAEGRGFTVVDPATVIVTHFAEAVKANAPELLSRQDVQDMIEKLREKEPAVVNELIPDLASVGTVQQVLRALLAEGVPVRDLSTILEAMADGLRATQALEEVVEIVRLALAPSICARLADDNAVIYVALVAPEVEQVILRSVTRTTQGTVCALDESVARHLTRAVAEQMQRAAALGHELTLLASPEGRRFVRKAFERSFPRLPVISYMEIAPGFSVETVGEISLPPGVALHALEEVTSVEQAA